MKKMVTNNIYLKKIVMQYFCIQWKKKKLLHLSNQFEHSVYEYKLLRSCVMWKILIVVHKV